MAIVSNGTPADAVRYVSPSGRSYARIESEQVLPLLIQEIPLDLEIIEVGMAGNREVPSYLRERRFRTLDPDPTRKPDICVDLRASVLPAASFDAMCLNQVLEHVDDLQVVVAECRRLIRPGGFIVVAAPWDYPYHAQGGAGDYWRISADGLTWLFRDWTIVNQMLKRSCSYLLARRPA